MIRLHMTSLNIIFKMKGLFWINPLCLFYYFGWINNAECSFQDYLSKCQYMVLKFQEINNSQNYTFYPIGYSAMSFSVSTTHDAHIALTTGPYETDNMYEVLVGGWRKRVKIFPYNKISATGIRKNKQSEPVMRVSHTSSIFNHYWSEPTYFWLRWFQGKIALGKIGEFEPFISWTDPEEVIHPTHFGIISNWSAIGKWYIQEFENYENMESCSWKSNFGGGIPINAFPAFEEESGQDNVYICRALYKGALLPGKLISNEGFCQISWGGKEFSMREYEVLTNGSTSLEGNEENDTAQTVKSNPVHKLLWNHTQVNQTSVPSMAVVAGETENGEPLYVGRLMLDGTALIGKVQESHSLCYFPNNGVEEYYNSCDVLTFIDYN